MKDAVRVLRIIEYAGEREWVEEMVKRSIHGTMATPKGSITAVTLHEYPEKLVEAQSTPDEEHPPVFQGYGTNMRPK